MEEYFSLKQQYEDKINQKKMKIIKAEHLSKREKKQKYAMIKKYCVRCKQLGGTNFEIGESSLKAVCSAANPCDLNINIQRTKSENIYEVETDVLDEINKIRREICEARLKYLYKYSNKEKTTADFEVLKKRLETYQMGLINIRKKIVVPDPNIITLEESLAQEVKQANPEHYVSVIRPLVEQIRDIKYKYAAVETDEKDVHYLVEKNITLDDIYQENIV